MTWRVNLQLAIAAWEAAEAPDDEHRIALLEWLAEVVEHGPPGDALSVPLEPELYLSRVPTADLVVSYLVITYEELVILKEITSL